MTLVNVVADLAEYVVTGDFDGEVYGTLFDADWNYEVDSRGAFDVTIEKQGVICTNCFFQMDMGILFKWDVTDYSTLRDFALLLRGDATAALNITLPQDQQLSTRLPLFRDVLLPAVGGHCIAFVR